MATAGYFVLDWSQLSGDNFLLQESRDDAFTAPVQSRVGEMSASTQTGLMDGTYFYRVRSPGGDWSNVIKVVVEHHPLSRAFLFFALGFMLFAALLVTLVIGHRRTAQQPI